MYFSAKHICCVEGNIQLFKTLHFGLNLFGINIARYTIIVLLFIKYTNIYQIYQKNQNLMWNETNTFKVLWLLPHKNST